MTEEEAQDALAGLVSRETCERLSVYVGVLEKWQRKINLVAPSTLSAIWSRHVLDSAQLFQHAPPTARHWLDLGSGGGLPGLVIAAMAREAAPELHVALVESDQRKAAFLREAARLMGLSVTVHNRRIADLTPQNADVISARALAPLPDLCAMSSAHLAPHGVCLFQKGIRHADEVEAARLAWHMSCDVFPSLTEAGAVILRIERLLHV